MGIRRAREILRLSPFYTLAELRLAFREAAKQHHPDRRGGDAERFREAVEAFHLLQMAAEARAKAPPMSSPPVVARPRPARALFIEISPLTALNGGRVEHELADGRRVRLTLPPGLRDGDIVRAGAGETPIRIRPDGDTLVRGDDLWLTVPVDAGLLAEGGRIAVETPLGRRVVWITRKAGERGLVRLVGQGLPARGPHAAGHLFLRLTARPGRIDSAARTLLRRFAAAWAA